MNANSLRIASPLLILREAVECLVVAQCLAARLHGEAGLAVSNYRLGGIFVENRLPDDWDEQRQAVGGLAS